MLGALPDPNWALRPRWKWYGDSDAVRIVRLLTMRRHIPRVRLMFFGIRKPYRHLGIDALLFTQMLEYAQTKHYLECEPSMLLEHNDLVIRASAFMGGREYKRVSLAPDAADARATAVPLRPNALGGDESALRVVGDLALGRPE